MNLDDLHDPDPPHPDVATLAAVGRRAQHLRRRRTFMVAAGGTLAVALVAVPVTRWLARDDDGRTVVTEDVTVPITTARVTVAPTTTVPVTTTPPTTAAPSAAGVALVAVRDDGDAVTIGADGVVTVVYDGNEPRTPPAEGEQVVVDSLVLTPTGRLFVSLCCEPVPGAFYEVVDGSFVGDVPRYDHALALSPDGTELAAIGFATVDKRPLDGNDVVSAGGEDGARTPYEVAWLGPDRLAVLEQRQVPPGPDELHLTLLDADLVGWATAPSAVIRTGIDGDWPSLAGTAADGSILVLDREADAATLVAYDPTTLERRPAQDVTLPAAAVDAWHSDAGTVWIDTDGGLHVGDATVPGRYRWARPAGPS